MKTIVRRASETPVTKTSFGVFDAQGREFGIKFLLYANRVEPAPEDAFVTSRIAPGYYFVARPHRTRDGFNFGPSQSEEFFDTPADREKYIADRTEKARKAATQKAKL